MSESPPGLASGRFGRLARKELVEILRDRRTVLTLVLMPLLLYPLLSVAFRQFLISGVVGTEAPAYRIGFASEDDAMAAHGFLTSGEVALARRGAFAGAQNSRPDALARPKWESFVLDDKDVPDALREAVAKGAVDLGVRVNPPGSLRDNVRENLVVELEMIYREDSEAGVDALHYLERLCREATVTFLARRLAAIGIDQRAEAVRPRPVMLPAPEGRRSRVFAVLLPLILILMTITGAVYPAIDLTAGERERGTLEVLIAAPVPRWALLGAKYLAVVTVAILTALVNLGSMTLTLWASGLGQALLGTGGLSPWLLPEVFGLLLLLAAFFSGVLLALTSFARSFKEAQAYLIPLMLASLMPGMIGLVPGLKLTGPLAVVPLINIVLLARDLLEGSANALAASVVVLTTALYAVAAVGIAARTFGAEAVLYTQEGGWGEMFRRPRRPRAAASASGALLCLALMFPFSFVLNRLIVEFQDAETIGLLAVQAAATVALFGVIPVAAAAYARVRPGTGFRLIVPKLGPCLAALLLGACLWPLAYEVGLALRVFNISTLGKDALDRVREMLDRYRAVPAPVAVAVLGVLPAVMEELFFRGYLFSALLSASRPRTAILTSALLFGVFHLITAGGLAVERLPISALLGVVLGWVCWKSGSVLPGMLLHASHNSLIVSLGLYQTQLKEWGFSAGEEEQLPAGVLLVGLAGSLIGLLWVSILPRPGDPVTRPDPE
jgi:ABC-2 type transport system permease protein/sodium transport system permease protein